MGDVIVIEAGNHELYAIAASELELGSEKPMSIDLNDSVVEFEEYGANDSIEESDTGVEFSEAPDDFETEFSEFEGDPEMEFAEADGSEVAPSAEDYGDETFASADGAAEEDGEYDPSAYEEEWEEEVDDDVWDDEFESEEGEEVTAEDEAFEPEPAHQSTPDVMDSEGDVLLELAYAAEDEEPTTHSRWSGPGVFASVLLHICAIAWLANETIKYEQSIPLPPVETRMLTKVEKQEEEEEKIDYELTNPNDKDFEVREVVNAKSVGRIKTTEPKVETDPKPIDEFNFTQDQSPTYDIPEGLEVDDSVVVKGTTGEAMVQLESALDRVTWEIAQNMKERKVLVVWLLDGSGSLTKQRQIIANRLERIYGELGALQDVGQIPRLSRPLITGVVSYGGRTNFLTREPTHKFEDVKNAVMNTPPDTTGVENIFTAVTQVMEVWGKYRVTNGRRIMVITVTDESGDDFSMHERAIVKCRHYGAKAYVIGPSAVFGKRKGFVPYTAPENNRVYRLPVDLGPETPMFENLAMPFWFDGPQYEYLSSGYGPYALARLVRETGGVYFTTNMTTMAGLQTVGKYETHQLKPFEPDYRFGTPEGYQRDLMQHPLRFACVTAAQLSRTNKPEETPQLQVVVAPNNFRQTATGMQETVAKTEYFIDQIMSAFPPDVHKLYDTEASLRWRMTYCLTYGRLLAMKVRALEYNFACADIKNSMSEQDIGPGTARLVFRPAAEIKYANQAKRMAQQSFELLQRCVDEAPGTPFAVMAARELRHPLGMRVQTFKIPPPPPVNRDAAAQAAARRRIQLAQERRNRPQAPPRRQPRPIPPKLPKL